jgi:hypothetical protein
MFTNSGRAVLDTANPIYDSIKAGMRDPVAATPPMKAMVEFARTEYIRSQTLRRVIDAARSGADPAADIAPRQLQEDITKLASLQPIVKLGVPPEQALRGFVDAFGGGEVSVFDIFRRMRSNLLGLVRNKGLAPSDARIASQLAQKLTESMETAVKDTGGQAAVDSLRQADRLWKQGRSLEELGDMINKATVGIRPSAQAAGARTVTQTYRASRLLEDTRRAMIEDYSGGKNLLERAVPDQIDRETYTAVVDALVRSLKTEGAGGIAARFHGLGVIAAVGGIATGHVAATGGLAGASELGAYIVSKAMTSQGAAKALQFYMRHPAGSREAIKAAQRLASWALESGIREGEE